jgi:hypothetical protein
MPQASCSKRGSYSPLLLAIVEWVILNVEL